MAKHYRKIHIRILLVGIALAISYGVYGLFQKDIETWNDKFIDQLFALRMCSWTPIHT
jgi:EamA domain-containing membrane protein RarD